jgi:hypothetical protein
LEHDACTVTYVFSFAVRYKTKSNAGKSDFYRKEKQSHVQFQFTKGSNESGRRVVVYNPKKQDFFVLDDDEREFTKPQKSEGTQRVLLCHLRRANVATDYSLYVQNYSSFKIDNKISKKFTLNSFNRLPFAIVPDQNLTVPTVQWNVPYKSNRKMLKLPNTSSVVGCLVHETSFNHYMVITVFDYGIVKRGGIPPPHLQ